MSPPPNNPAATNALVGIWTLLLTAFVFATLYLARDLLVPLTLAALLAFLLTPLVTRLERAFGRVGAVLLVVVLIFAVAGAAGWVLTRQLSDLALKLPDYQQNIQTKLRSFKVPTGGRLTKMSDMLNELKKEFPGGTAPKIAPVPGRPEVTESRTQPAAPLSVIVMSPTDPYKLLPVVIAPLVGPLGNAALVLLLVIFMLLKREDLRSRLIRLIGQGRISATSRAMGDAGARVSRYLLMQLAVNVTYGICVALGLHFIGVPNAVLWGAFATLLRFIPYVGPWIGAVIPIVLSLAVSPGWMMPLLTVGLFVILELLSNNIMEPWLYGSSTGVAPVALIFAAACWTWLWGPVGLVLATPITVCLVVMGRYIPRLSFLSVVLSDRQALTPAEDCYYRLLTIGDQDEIELVESYLKENSLTELYDSVFIPVITAVEIDHRLDLLDDNKRTLIIQSLRDIIEDLGARARVESKIEALKSPGALERVATDRQNSAPSRRVYCVPARADRDELVGAMLVQLLQQEGCETQNAPPNLGVPELIDRVVKAGVDVVCISVVAPSTVLHARYLCLKLREHLPRQRILVGLWGATENVAEATRRVRDSGAEAVVTTFAEAVALLSKPVSPLGEPVVSEEKGTAA